MSPARRKVAAPAGKSAGDLGRYRAKRDFARTPEPAGERDAAGAAGGPEGLYVVQKHHARHLHLWVTGNCAGNRPFRYRLGDVAAEELSFPASSNFSAVSINSRGETAGTAVKPGTNAPDGYTALLWTANPSSPVDLNAGQAFAPASAWNVHATDISETGTVLAGYNDTTGNFYTFLLTPAP